METIEVKAKGLLECEPKRTAKMDGTRIAILVKMDNVCSRSKERLLALWEIYKENEIMDIDVPLAMPRPTIPILRETEIGRAAARSADLACANDYKLPDETLKALMESLTRDTTKELQKFRNPNIYNLYF